MPLGTDYFPQIPCMPSRSRPPAVEVPVNGRILRPRSGPSPSLPTKPAQPKKRGKPRVFKSAATIDELESEDEEAWLAIRSINGLTC